MRLPSTLMIWWSGSTLAPYRRTISPSTSTRPSPISSSQCRRLPTPAAASTFCRRTPPGTSMSESCPGSAVTSMPCAVFPRLAPSGPSRPPARPSRCGRPPGPPPRPGRPPRRSLPSLAWVLIARVPGTRRVLEGLSVLGTVGIPDNAAAPGIAGVPGTAGALGAAGVLFGPGVLGPAGARDAVLGAVGILDLVGQEGCEFGQLIQAGQAKPFQEVPGRAVQDGAGLMLGARLLDQAPQGQGAHHAVTVDAAHRRDPRPADRLPVGDHGQRLQRGLGQPDLLPVADEALHHRCAVLAGIEAPAACHLTQVETTALGGVRGSEAGDLSRDLLSRALKNLGEHHHRNRLVRDQQDRFQAGPQAGAGLGLADRVPRPVATHHVQSSSSPAPMRGPVSGPAQVTYRSPSGTSCSNETLPSR